MRASVTACISYIRRKRGFSDSINHVKHQRVLRRGFTARERGWLGETIARPKDLLSPFLSLSRHARCACCRHGSSILRVVAIYLLIACRCTNSTDDLSNTS